MLTRDRYDAERAALRVPRVALRTPERNPSTIFGPSTPRDDLHATACVARPRARAAAPASHPARRTHHTRLRPSLAKVNLDAQRGTIPAPSQRLRRPGTQGARRAHLTYAVANAGARRAEWPSCTPRRARSFFLVRAFQNFASLSANPVNVVIEAQPITAVAPGNRRERPRCNRREEAHDSSAAEGQRRRRVDGADEQEGRHHDGVRQAAGRCRRLRGGRLGSGHRARRRAGQHRNGARPREPGRARRRSLRGSSRLRRFRSSRSAAR